MWVTKLLISPVKKRIFCPKTTKFGLNLAHPFIGGSFDALLVGWLVVVARAVSRKTPLYFILRNAERIVFYESTRERHTVVLLKYQFSVT